MTRRVQASPVLAAYRTATASRIAICGPRTAIHVPRITSRCYNSKASNPGPNVGGPLGNGYPDWWRKTSNLGRDGPDSLERLGSSHTIFTLPGATKDLVLDLVRKGSQLPREAVPEADEAAVILASPRHASWLTDRTFMASLVSSLQGSQVSDDPAAGPKHFHVLAAVVDSLCPESESHHHHQPQEGLSIHLGRAESLLPGLWNDTAAALPPVQTVDEPSHLMISINKTAHSEDKMSVTLPLANTLFQNGRRSTLLASKWATQGGSLMSPVVSPSNQLLQMLDKRCQTICLPPSSDSSHLAINSSLTPITWPRMILESLGNILAKVDIEGVPSPASKELQINVPRLIEARRSSHAGYKNAQARIGVWAAIIPGKLILPDAITNSTQGLHQDIRLKDNFSEDQVKALPFNLFTSSSPHERQGWPTHTAIGPALLQGCRLHRIMSGGGEWGAKASLLSLDPQTSYGLENEQDELLRFQRSFFGEEEADEAIAKPGDFVQFYVDKETHSLTEIRDGEDITGSSLPTKYPRVVFGVGEHSPAESDAPTEAASESTAAKELAWLVPDHFGGISAEALYIESASQGVKTKLDAPGMRITLGSRRRP